jgi:AcrR family transcriptional regulator
MTAGAQTGREGTVSARQRILDAAYELFSRRGIQAVGVDTVIAEANVAKATLYRNFASKEELVLAFLSDREDRWTYGWVRDQVRLRGGTPGEQLLRIFEIFGEWFEDPDFEGCAFINILLEVPAPGASSHIACVRHLENIRAFLRELAGEAGIKDTDAFARQWHILMKGSIVAAGEGDTQAAERAREIGMLLLDRHGVSV